MQNIISTSNEFFFLAKKPVAAAAAAAAAPAVAFDLNFPNLLKNAQEITAKISLDGKIRRNAARGFVSGNFAGKFTIKLTGSGFVDFATESSVKDELLFVSSVLQLQYGVDVNRRPIAFNHLFERGNVSALNTAADGRFVNPAANIDPRADQSQLYYWPIVTMRIRHFEITENWSLHLEEI